MALQQDQALGKYRLIKPIGSGGMADVYLAEDTQMGREVALKVLPPEFSRHGDNVARFQKEVQAAAKLSHAHVVTVYDVGAAEIGGLTYHYYAMQLLPGGDLKSRIIEGLTEQQALGIAIDIAKGLGFAHRHGIVHRDIKPENVLFDSSNHAVLTDLGIAKAIGSGTKMTQTGMSIGTPHYMSPEQARGQAVDGRSDLYSLGVVLYEMLTGQVPYQAADTLAVAYSHVNDPIPQLPANLSQYQGLIDSLMAKQPEERFANAEALITTIEQLQQGGSYKAPAKTRVLPKVEANTATVAKNHTLYWLLGGSGAAAALAVGLYISGVFDTATTPRSVATGAVSTPKPLAIGQAILNITSEPAGAEVSLNGQIIGQTPLYRDNLPAGTHQLKVSHSFYAPVEQSLNLQDNQVTSPQLQLKPGEGAITLITEPSGAWVEIDGIRIQGTTPLTINPVPAGERNILIGKAGLSAKLSATLNHGQTLREERSLKAGYLVQHQHQWHTPEALLSQIEADISADRLLQPDNNNALSKVTALESNPDFSAQTNRARMQIADRYLALAEQAAKAGDIARTTQLAQNAETAAVDYAKAERQALVAQAKQVEATRLALAKEQQQKAEAKAREERIARLTQEAEQAAGQGKTDEVTRLVAELNQLVPASRARWQGLVVKATEEEEANRRRLEQLTGKLVNIPAGSFTMGCSSGDRECEWSEMVTRQVTINAFKLMETEVTFAMWDACVADGGCSHRPDDRGWGRGNLPVINVSYNDITQQYIPWLNRKTGQTFRLPSEAEWEYAARAGSSTKYNLGNELGRNNANCVGCGSQWDNKQTAPVKSFKPNNFGLYDMHGNVWECTADCWNSSYHGAPTNGSVWQAGPWSGDCGKRVVRGGSWDSYSSGLRVSTRSWLDTADRRNDRGFRLAQGE